MNNGSDHESRLTRLEDFVEVLTNEHIEFAAEHRRLLTAQVLMQDSLTRLETDLGKLKEAQDENEKRLGILLLTFDDFIRRTGRSGN